MLLVCRNVQYNLVPGDEVMDDGYRISLISRAGHPVVTRASLQELIDSGVMSKHTERRNTKQVTIYRVETL